MKKYFVLMVLLIVPVLVSAHEVKQTGSLEILLHMEPGDEPTAREAAQMYFSVSDSKEKFNYSDCDCSVKVVKGTQEVLNRKITPADDAPDWGTNVARIPIIFPEIGIYQVTLTGKSLKQSFNDFSLVYDKRIEKESIIPAAEMNTESDSNILDNYYVIGCVLLISAIIIYTLINRSRKKLK